MAETLKLFGPPGTGKTHTLLNILEKELKAGVHPRRIAYLSFTVAARTEAVERAGATLDLDEADLENFRTLHSVAYRQLDMNRAGLITRAKDLEPFARMMGMEFQSAADAGGLNFGQRKADQFLAFDHYRRHRKMSVQDAYQAWPDPLPWFEIEFFCRQYAEWKKAEGWADFTDLLESRSGLKPLEVDVVFIDEAQDLSRLQWAAMDVIAAKAARVYIAGDDDQAIFSWAGAEPDEFLNRPGRTEVLGQSYRLPRQVHALAGRLIGRLEGDRQAKTWKPRDEEGTVRKVPSVRGMDIPDAGSVLVLYRNHYLAAGPERWLRDHGHPYEFNNRRAPGLDHAEAIIAWHRWTAKDEALPRPAVVKILEAMNGTQERVKELKKVERDTLLAYSDVECGRAKALQWWEALDTLTSEQRAYLRSIGRRFGPKVLVDRPRIRLSTIHASKGAEADHVVVLTDVSSRVRKTIKHRPDAEVRVFYVGVTRARKSLTLVGDQNPLFKGL